MRLLHRNKEGEFELTKDMLDQVPKYAILSHTWLADDKEISLEDLIEGNARRKPAGFHKIKFCGERAARDNLDYFWVDTCCINKSSSAELQEAITTMFHWYRNATRCYVYLTDVSVPECEVTNQVSQDSWEAAFRNSRWFTRGWTLQELVAPVSVEFFSVEGTRLGDKKSLQHYIHETTGIPYRALQGDALNNFSAEERLLWAEKRQTKRKEDKAYSLLGMFSIFIPIMYGEGDHAFVRLQEEINKKHPGSGKLDSLLSKLPTAPQAAFNSHDNQHAPTCLPDTRRELLGVITKWVDGEDESRVFWLNGIAGSGKSTVARTIARTYHDRAQLGASFFFSRGGGDVGLADRLFTTLASQLASRIPAARDYICEAIKEHTDIAEQSLRDQWEQLILNPLSRLNRVSSRSTIVFVVDALDECDSERDIGILLRLLATTDSMGNIRLRIFITSRPEIPIRCGFSHIPEAERKVFILHEVSPTIMDRDLSLFFEHNFMVIREERGFDIEWPGTRIIKRLVEISCGLFIWASTACRFIREGKRLAKRRISTLINDHRSGAGPEKRLDEIYITVLKDSIQQAYDEEEKKELYDMLREVLGSIVILFSPLSIDSLAQLLRLPASDISETLADLHTIFHVPSQTNSPIRPHHPTFRDFLLDRKRCRDLDFWVDEQQIHKDLGDKCIQLMSKMLKRNICSLQSPGTIVQDIDLNLIEQRIPHELQYACLYWAQHYRQSGTHLCDGDPTHRFFQEHFLHWLEALNLIGKGLQAGAIIRMYQSLLVVSLDRYSEQAQPINIMTVKSADNLRQVPFVKDARRFIFAYHSIIEQAPLQTYCAALAFIRPTNELRHHYWSQVQFWAKDIRIAEADGPKVKDEYNYVNDIAFTPDGRKIASGSINEVVRVWNVSNKTSLGKFEGQVDKVSSVAISPNGKMIASGSDDTTVMVWDLETRVIKYTLKGHSRWVNSVVFSPDGTMLASASMDETIRVCHAVTGQELNVFDGHSSCVNSIAFSPDSALIVSGSVDQMVRIWDVVKGEVCLLLDGHSGCVNSVRFSPNGKQVISASDDMTCRIWDMTTGTEKVALKGHSKKVTAVTFSPDARLVASGSDDKTVRLWNASAGTLLSTLEGHTSGINAVTFSPNGQLLVSGSFNDEVRLWDGTNGANRGAFDDLEDTIKPGLPLGHQMRTLDLDEKTLSVDYQPLLAAHEEVKGHSSAVTCVVFSKDGQLIATGSRDTTIKLWAREGKEYWKLEGHSGSINHLELSPDGHIIASASMDKTVKIWRTTTGLLLHTLKGHSDDIGFVRFSSNGHLLASCSTDTKLWDVATGTAVDRLAHQLQKVTNISFSPDDRIIASCSANEIRLWDISTGAATGMLVGHSDTVNSLAFSPDSSLLVSCSTDMTIRLWNTMGAACGTMKGHTVPMNSIAFSPDNKLVVSCSDDGVLMLWNVETQLAQGKLEFDVSVRTVSFSNCSQYIETDRGALDIKSFRSPSSSLPKDCQHTLFVTREWLKRKTDNILWLPSEYHATCVATSSNTVVLGHFSGSISFSYF